MYKSFNLFIEQFLYSFRVYGFRRSQQTKIGIADYNSTEWGRLRSKDFDRPETVLSSVIDYRKLVDLVEELSHHQKDEISILDFGGGNLNLYKLLTRKFPNLKIYWVLVENRSYFEVLKESWGETQEGYMRVDPGFRVSKYPNLFISPQIPDRKFDICIAGAVLGWVSNPMDTRNRLANNCEYLFIFRTLMSNKRSRCGWQRTYIGEETRKIPCWFLNQAELVKTPSFHTVEIWDSSPETIFSIFGVWKFKSLYLKRFN